jgi:hypothetical protein
MSLHRYPAASLRADYLRAGLGALLSGGLALLARGEPLAVAIFGGCALLFLAFALRTWRRQRAVVELGDEGISTSGGRCVTLPWRQLTAVKLRYYATKRDRTGGWMQLNLAAGPRRLTIESSIEGFAELVRRVAREAEANGLTLDPVTSSNLLALGPAAAERR